MDRAEIKARKDLGKPPAKKVKIPGGLAVISKQITGGRARTQEAKLSVILSKEKLLKKKLL